MPSYSSCSYYTCFFFFFNDTATTEIYTLSLHDALPILHVHPAGPLPVGSESVEPVQRGPPRSAERRGWRERADRGRHHHLRRRRGAVRGWPRRRRCGDQRRHRLHRPRDREARARRGGHESARGGVRRRYSVLGRGAVGVRTSAVPEYLQERLIPRQRGSWQRLLITDG